MNIIKRNERANPKVSLILLDWGVRESFHLLHYIKTQTVLRDAFEVIVIEYYDYVSPAAQKFESEVDTWILLQMPDDCYYHKHLMYNTGIVFSKADILMFGDSDAMVRPTFIERIITSFESDPLLVYHMDEFRNVRRDLYPFNYPSFEEVLGDGCINNVGGKTKGVLDLVDPIHSRNYGACMCGRRDDIISIGGADEDLTYLGHICGPYDMTFRLMNLGRRLRWETEEYLYHTWHPGTDGTDNYLGPHDGMNMSTTAFQALSSGRISPLVENRAIRLLRTEGRQAEEPSPALLDLLVDPSYKDAFGREKLGSAAKKRVGVVTATKPVFATYKGFDIYQIGNVFYGVPDGMGVIDPAKEKWRSDDRVITGKSFSEIQTELDGCEAQLIETVSNANICAVGNRYAIVPHSLGRVDFRIRKQRNVVFWADTLAQARQKAVMVASAGHEPRSTNIERKAAGAGDEAHDAPQPVSISALSQQIAQLNQRLYRLEADVASIYHSRIWRTLVRIGGIINAILRKPA
ncbi:MAG: hypothetical protein DMG12_16430 [Acidobacteria bacterium]|nr:MAG: hypothetical protein DMG12_16430 [Acidobacteriota bacterium]